MMAGRGGTWYLVTTVSKVLEVNERGTICLGVLKSKEHVKSCPRPLPQRVLESKQLQLCEGRLW